MATDWRSDRDYLDGCGLFDAGDYWDAHERWERCWLAADDERTRHFLQGLVQCAAAAHNLARGKPRGARTVLGRALGHLAAAGDQPFMGIDPVALAAAMRAHVEDGAAAPTLGVTP